MAKLTLTDIASGYLSVTVINANNTLIENALENTLSRDGTTPNTMGAALDMNSNKITNLTDGTNNQDAATVAQINASAQSVVTLNGLTDVTISSASSGEYIRYNGSAWVDASLNVVDDTTPQLGGNLASNGNDIALADNDQILFGTGTDVALDFDGTNLVLQNTSATDFNVYGFTEVNVYDDDMSFTANGFYLTGGKDLHVNGGFARVSNTAVNQYLDISHNGANDINFTHSGITDWNITGLTSIQAGTVDADFDAITATSYGGITEANLVDKTASESISGAWSGSGTLDIAPAARSVSSSGNTATTDYSKVINLTGGSGQTFTLDGDPPTNAIIFIDNSSGNSWTIAASTSLIWAKDASTGNRTLADDGVAIAKHRGSGTWVISGSALLT